MFGQLILLKSNLLFVFGVLSRRTKWTDYTDFDAMILWDRLGGFKKQYTRILPNIKLLEERIAKNCCPQTLQKF